MKIETFLEGCGSCVIRIPSSSSGFIDWVLYFCDQAIAIKYNLIFLPDI
jgi:hypothetical protein